MTPRTRRRTVAVLATEIERVESIDLLATVRFSFSVPVTARQLSDAILRAVNTPAFGISGQCTIVTIRPTTEVVGPTSAALKIP